MSSRITLCKHTLAVLLRSGLEFRDSTHLISPKSTKIVKAGMTFNVAVGVQNVPVDSEVRGYLDIPLY